MCPPVDKKCVSCSLSFLHVMLGRNVSLNWGFQERWVTIETGCIDRVSDWRICVYF